jgi:hypothetical protein
VKAGILKSIRTRRGRSTSRIEIDLLILFLRWLNGRNIPLVNSVKYRGVIFDKKITWRLQIEAIEDEAV